jgi:NarL family two-component system response regulator LiaR
MGKNGRLFILAAVIMSALSCTGNSPGKAAPSKYPSVSDISQAWLEAKIKLNPDIIILDISLGKEDGLTVIPEIRKICAKRKVPFPGILVYTMHEDLFLIQRAFDLGAAAYVAKSAESGEILTAIDALLAGNTYVNPKYQTSNLHAFASLSVREKEIITLLKQSLDNQQIAERLFLSVRTVENHLAHIYDKTGVSSRKELLAL